MNNIKRTWSIEEKISILKDIQKTGVVEGADGLVPHYGRKEASELKKILKENEQLKKLLAEKELELSLKTELLKKRWHDGRVQRNS